MRWRKIKESNTCASEWSAHAYSSKPRHTRRDWGRLRDTNANTFTCCCLYKNKPNQCSVVTKTTTITVQPQWMKGGNLQQESNAAFVEGSVHCRDLPQRINNCKKIQLQIEQQWERSRKGGERPPNSRTTHLLTGRNIRKNDGSEESRETSCLLRCEIVTRVAWLPWWWRTSSKRGRCRGLQRLKRISWERLMDGFTARNEGTIPTMAEWFDR